MSNLWLVAFGMGNDPMVHSVPVIEARLVSLSVQSWATTTGNSLHLSPLTSEKVEDTLLEETTVSGPIFAMTHSHLKVTEDESPVQ